MIQLNKQNETIKIRCPCCDEEIVLEINISKNKINKISKNLDIEFGTQNGGEKELNE